MVLTEQSTVGEIYAADIDSQLDSTLIADLGWTTLTTPSTFIDWMQQFTDGTEANDFTTSFGII